MHPQFTADRQQKFREITASNVNTFCSTRMCNVVQFDRDIHRYAQIIIISVTLSEYYNSVAGLKVNPANVAVPISLIIQKNESYFQFTLYIHLIDGFLSKQQLQLAVEVMIHVTYSDLL